MVAAPAQALMLRGINLGPNRRVAMADLRALLAGAGYENVRTYVQSGNVVLNSPAPAEELERDTGRLISERFGIEVAVIARTRDQLAEVVRRNPLGAVATDPRRYQVSFLSAELEAETIERLQERLAEAEAMVVAGREVFVWHPEGVARSKLWNLLASRSLGVTATARNWTTVCALLALADPEAEELRCTAT